MTGRCVLLVCVSPLLIARLLESRCNDVSFAQKHTSDRYGVGLQTDCTLRETATDVPSWPQCRLASSLMREGWRGHVCRCVRDRVCRRCASIVVVTRFLVWGGGGGEEQVHPPGEVYAWFMLGLCALPTTRPVRTQCQRSAFCVRVPTNPLHVESSPLDTLVVGASRQIFRPRRPQHHATLCRTRD